MSNPVLSELKRIRAALERPRVEPAFVDYATAARMLCCSKRSIERLIAEKRLKTYDIAGPKLRVSDLRALGEPRRRVTRKARQEQSLDAVAEEARTEGQGG